MPALPVRIDISIQIIVNGVPFENETISAIPRDANEAAVMIEDAKKFLTLSIIPIMENE